MKKLIYTLSILLLSTTMLFAQKRLHKRPSAEQRAERSVKLMSERLSLTEKQQKQLLEMQLQKEAKMEGFRKSAMEARKSEMKVRRDYLAQQHRKFEDILSEEQRAKLKNSRDKGRERFDRSMHKKPQRRFEGRK